MNLTAVFENWHIGDGNYPPLHRGQLVNLSFEVESRTLAKTSLKMAKEFTHVGNAEYRFCGDVLNIYRRKLGPEIIIIEADSFRFYILSRDVGRYAPADIVVGTGTLLLDHFIWAENLEEYTNPPDLFYTLTVKQIRKVQTPEQFIKRYEGGKSFPTRLDPKDYDDIHVEELETMEGQLFDEEFYIIDFDLAEAEKGTARRTFTG